MDKKTMIEKLVRDAHEKAGFTGTWLYAEKGEIVSSGKRGHGIRPCLRHQAVHCVGGNAS